MRRAYNVHFIVYIRRWLEQLQLSTGIMICRIVRHRRHALTHFSRAIRSDRSPLTSYEKRRQQQQQRLRLRYA